MSAIETIETKKDFHQTFLRFGTGEIMMQCASREVNSEGGYTLGILSLTEQEPHEIGSGSHDIYGNYDELKEKAPVFLTFKNVESIEAIERSLGELKHFMLTGEWIKL